MKFTLDDPADELSILRENDPDGSRPKNTPNPRLARALDNYARPGNRHLPVGTDNIYIPVPDNQPLLSNPKNKRAYEEYDNSGVNKYISWPLRFAFEAVAEVTSDNPNNNTYFITVNLSKKTSRRLVHNSKNAPAAYVDRISKRLKPFSGLNNFIVVLEPSKDGTLHAHFVASMTPASVEDFKAVLEKDTNKASNAVQFKTEYRRYHSARPGTQEWEMLEIDDEYGLSNYPDRDARGRYRMEPVDAGSADYLAKDFQRRIQGFTGQHWSAPAHIKQRGAALYQAAYAAQ